MTELYFVRHAQPTRWSNKLKLRLFHESSALSEKGRTQAIATAQYLLSVSVTRLFSSPVPRALETGQLVAKTLGLNLEVRPELKEQDWGRLKGLRPEHIPKLFPVEWQKWQSGDPNYAPPGGETTETFLTRVDRMLAEMEAVSGVAVAVTHFGFIQGVVCRILGLPFRFRMPLEFAEASITHVRSLEGERVLVSLNDADHWQLTLGKQAG